MILISYQSAGNANKYAKSGANVSGPNLHAPVHAGQSRSADHSWQAWTSTQPGGPRCSQEGTHGLSIYNIFTLFKSPNYYLTISARRFKLKNINLSRYIEMPKGE